MAGYYLAYLGNYQDSERACQAKSVGRSKGSLVAIVVSALEKRTCGGPAAVPINGSLDA